MNTNAYQFTPLFSIGERVYFKPSFGTAPALGVIIRVGINNTAFKVHWDNGVWAWHDINEIGGVDTLIEALHKQVPLATLAGNKNV